MSYQVRPGVTETVPGRLVETQREGGGVLLERELPPGLPVLVTGDIETVGVEVTVLGKVIWCRRRDAGPARLGVQFSEVIRSTGGEARQNGSAPVQNEQQTNQHKPGPGTPTPDNAKDKAHDFASLDTDDFYEILQIGQNADSEMISRVFRLLAQRYHPDNRESGNADSFRKVLAAYRTLSDPEARAAYDATHPKVRRNRWRIFDQACAVQGPQAEKAKRDGVLGLLYTKRLQVPQSPVLSAIELEDLLAVPREHLEFSLWYLRENGYIAREDNGKYWITVNGVDLAEQVGAAWLRPDRLLPSAAVPEPGAASNWP